MNQLGLKRDLENWIDYRCIVSEEIAVSTVAELIQGEIDYRRQLIDWGVA